jgi:hypothetical protein
VSWWWLIAPVLAALVVGRPVEAPGLRPEIPEDSCGARRLYFLAYTYARERPDAARKLLAAAELARAGCAENTEILAERIAELKLD